jgi:hypothetical protein
LERMGRGRIHRGSAVRDRDRDGDRGRDSGGDRDRDLGSDSDRDTWSM